ncbi:extracellular solute-binding protein [Aromatoleum toluvorans]|uniref:Extracellular solute-binding protein n=1 Tax=Aromatoleum toluvorans TaxID=92002 RepID=A0ABX1Q5S8_9RHOO|nr:ABC transporter substrate-binding protein [Aromatoleum toluvorans]NMG46122.1 extracellular solute-binding protein [Aromatoleum toluvorans]
MNNARILGAIALAGCATTVNAASELTFVTWGGSYQAAQESTTVKPFATKSGVKVKVDTYNGGVAQIRSQVETNNVTWDVVDLLLPDANRACDEGLLEKIAPADLASAKDGRAADKDYLPGGLSNCLAGTLAYSTLITYNKDKVKGAPPSKIADFFDLKKYPGKRALKKSPESALEWALMADGVPPNQVYQVLGTPAGLDRAFKKLDTIKSSIVWWEAGAQPPQLLADGEVVMTSAYNNRIYNAMISDKKPFGFIWDGQLKNVTGYGIVKGTKNLKAAKDFLRYSTNPELLATFASTIALGPLRESALPLVDAKVRPYLPTAPENQSGALDVDPVFWADRGDDLNQKFAVWLAQ